MAIKEKNEKRLYYNNEELIKYDLPYCLDFFALLIRRGVKPEYELIKKFELALVECSNVAIRMMFFAREKLKDVKSYKILLKYLANNCPAIMSKTIRFIPKHSCAEDLLILVGTPSENALGKYLRRRLTERKKYTIFQGRWIWNQERKYFLLSSDVLRIVIWLKKLEKRHDIENIKMVAKLLKLELNEYTQHFHKLWKLFEEVWNYEYPKKLIRMPNKILEYKPTKNFYFGPKLFEKPNKYNKWQNMILRNTRGIFGNRNFCAKNFYQTFANPQGKTDICKEMICELVQKIVLRKHLTPHAVECMNYLWDNFTGFGGDNKVLVALNTEFTSAFRGRFYTFISSVGIALILCTAHNFHNEFAGRFLSLVGKPCFLNMCGNNFVDKVRYIKAVAGTGPADAGTMLELILTEAKKYKISKDSMPNDIVFMGGPYNSCDKSVKSLKKRFAKSGYNFPNLIFWDAGIRRNCCLEVSNSRIMVGDYSHKLFERVVRGQMNILGYVMCALDEYADIVRTNDKFNCERIIKNKRK